jgi:hypothetical protein
MPELLRAMADRLNHEMEAIGFEPNDDKTYHVVYWRAAGVAVTVFGDPKDEPSWAETLNAGFWTAFSNGLMAFVENELDHDLH